MEPPKFDERLRLRLRGAAARITVEPDAWDRLERRVLGRRRRRTALAVAGTAVVAGAVALSVSVLQRPFGEPPVAGSATTIGPGTTLEPGRLEPKPRGLDPPRRQVGDRVEYKLTPVAGESFLISLPLNLADQADPMAVPDAPLAVRGSSQSPRSALTTASAEAAADLTCAGYTATTGDPCTPRRLETTALPSGGRLSHWRLAYPDETTTTVQLGAWTLVLEGPEPRLAEVIAKGLTYSTTPDRFLRLRSTSPEIRVGIGGATLYLGASAAFDEVLSISVRPGCSDPQAEGLERTSLQRPEDPQGNPDAHHGIWCLGRGAYEVDVFSPRIASPDLIDSLYRELRVTSA